MTWDSIIRVIQDTASQEEQKAFQEWLNADHQNRALYQFLQQQHSRVNEPRPEDEVNLEWSKLKFKLAAGTEVASPAVTKKNAGSAKRYLPYAAAVLILMFSASLLWFYKANAVTTAPTEALVSIIADLNQKEVLLPDSTVVWLGRNTTLQYAANSFNQQERKVYLKGEAFFQVKRNEQKPFKVKTSQLEVKVLGTSFNVFARQQQPEEVSVATGLVAVQIKDIEQQLTPGQMLTYEANTHQSHLKTIPVEEAQSLKQAILHFEHNNLKQIAQQLERWYQVKVILKNQRSAQLSFTGHIPDTGIQHVLEGLTFATGLSYTLASDNTIIIE